jgi:hypothetical protein
VTYSLCVLAGLLIGGLAAWLVASASWREKLTRDTARLEWHEVTKVAHYYLPACAVLGTADRSVDALTKPMQLREEPPPYGGQNA